MNSATTWTIAIAMLASVSAVQAHHTGSMYEQSPIWIKGIQTSNDSQKSWLDVLNSNPRARDVWCQQREWPASQSTTSSRELVDEIDRWIDRPCQ